MLRRCGFVEKWREWIAHCISTMRFSVLINGTPFSFFNNSHGLRQKILYPRCFLCLLWRPWLGCCPLPWIGAIIRFNELLLSRFLFVDDTLIICEGDTNHLRHLRCLFLCFEVVLGLKINLAKLELVLVGVMEDVGGLTHILDCMVSSLPMKYLDLPFGASFKAKSIWDSIIEKMKCRLASWKWFYLSKGGRITMIKITLTNLPTYYLFLFPICWCDQIALCNFSGIFCGVELVSLNFILFCWSKICSLISSGGLGVLNLLLFDRTLSGKCLWHYAT